MHALRRKANAARARNEPKTKFLDDLSGPSDSDIKAMETETFDGDNEEEEEEE